MSDTRNPDHCIPPVDRPRLSPHQWIMSACAACDGLPDPAAAIREAREALEEARRAIVLLSCPTSADTSRFSAARQRIGDEGIARCVRALAALTPKRGD